MWRRRPYRSVLLLSVVVLLVTVGCAGAPAQPAVVPPSSEGGLPPLPAGWPRTLELGRFDAPGAWAETRASAPFGFRWLYLAGGVNTGHGWATWNPDGSFVSNFVQESAQTGTIPVFTYYMMYQSRPGNTQSEAEGLTTNLRNTETMTAYYNDVELFLQRASASPATMVVLHVEPDLWGYIQQRAR